MTHTYVALLTIVTRIWYVQVDNSQKVPFVHHLSKKIERKILMIFTYTGPSIMSQVQGKTPWKDPEWSLQLLWVHFT